MADVLFDFFGTLADYSPSRTEQGYYGASDVLQDLGCNLEYEDWLAMWSASSERLDVEANASGVEFSMHDAFAAFALEAGLVDVPRRHADRFIARYLAEWSRAVRLIDGVPPLLRRLRLSGRRTGLVTNTHSAAMVHAHLDAMGISGSFDAVVTFVEAGYRKPRAEIFAAALSALNTGAEEMIFVGDSFEPDYLGPTRVGIEAYLIAGRGEDRPAEVPASRVITSVLELEERLGL
ncbi:MAG: HAD family hydrolase [Acidimicrobiales bacterium]